MKDSTVLSKKQIIQTLCFVLPFIFTTAIALLIWSEGTQFQIDYLISFILIPLIAGWRLERSLFNKDNKIIKAILIPQGKRNEKVGKIPVVLLIHSPNLHLFLAFARSLRLQIQPMIFFLISFRARSGVSFSKGAKSSKLLKVPPSLEDQPMSHLFFFSSSRVSLSERKRNT